MSSRSSRVIAGVIAAIVLVGGGFVAGTAVANARAATGAAPTATPSQVTGAQGRRVVPGGQGTATGALTPVAGRVISVNEGSITVEVRQQGQSAQASPAPSSEIALVGPTTRLVKTAETDIKLSDIKAGDQVTIVGAMDTSTGTVSANAIVVGGGSLQQLLGGQRAGAPGRPDASPSPR
jgi:hypothetical protein